MSLLTQDLNSATILTLWTDIEALNRSEKEVFTQAIKKVKKSLEVPPQIENFMVFRTELFQSSQWPARWG